MASRSAASGRPICVACDLAVGERFFTEEPVGGEKRTWCDTCYRLRKLGILDYQGHVDVERRQYDEEGM